MLTRGGSYIDLPKWVKDKHCCINPKNEDKECFKWGVIAALHHNDINNHSEKVSKLKPYIDQYNWDGLEFPMSINKISKFEKNNPDIAVNVLFIYKDKKESKEDEKDSKEDEKESKEDEKESKEDEKIKDGKITILRRSNYNTNRKKYY